MTICKVTPRDVHEDIKEMMLAGFETNHYKISNEIFGKDGSSIFEVEIPPARKRGVEYSLDNLQTKVKQKYDPQFDDLTITKEYDGSKWIVNLNVSREMTDLLTDTAKEMSLDNKGVFTFLQKESDNQGKTQLQLDVESNIMPTGDNFKEHVNFLTDQVERAKERLKTLKRNRKQGIGNHTDLTQKIKKATITHNIIAKELHDLSAEKEEHMYHALFTQIARMSSKLDNIEDIDLSFDIQNFKDDLAFLHKFIVGVDYANADNPVEIDPLASTLHEDHAELRKQMTDLIIKYDQKLTEIVTNTIKEDISVANNVSEEEIEKLLEATGDITWLERMFLGINSSSNDDTILPSVIKSWFEKQGTWEQSRIKDIIDTMTAAFRKLEARGENLDFLIERNERGINQGNIATRETPLWRREVNNYFKINRGSTSLKEKYGEKVQWLNLNTVVLDPRKLRAIKDVYGVAFPDRFKIDGEDITEEEMDAYEESLRAEVGEGFDEHIQSLLTSLQEFEEEVDNINKDAGNSYSSFNAMKANPWVFAEHYSKNMESSTLKEEGFTDVVPDLRFVRFAPKRTFFNADNTGYYNENFESIETDPDKLALIQAMQDAYKYINNTFGKSTIDKMSYAKFVQGFAEVLGNAKGLGKASKGALYAVDSLKKLFYEKGDSKDEKGVIKKYQDNTKIQIKNYVETLRLKSNEELIKQAIDLGIIQDNQVSNFQELAEDIATTVILDRYSPDIINSTIALLNMAAMHNAQEATLPVAKLALEAHKKVTFGDNEKRPQSVAKLTEWIDRVLRNKHETYDKGAEKFLGKPISKSSWLYWLFDKVLGKIPYLNAIWNVDTLKYYTPAEKEYIKELAKIKLNGLSLDTPKLFKYKEGDITYEIGVLNGQYVKNHTEFNEAGIERPVSVVLSEDDFNAVFAKYIQQKKDQVGLDMTTAGFVQGILKSIIIKGLAFNPISGIFNRVEGKNSGLIMDSTGYYWTTGNVSAANSFMAFANFRKFSHKLIKHDLSKRGKQMEIFQLLVDNAGVIQDRKSELEREREKNTLVGSGTLMYRWAVDNPEFKNQGAIILSILMDSKITDENGKVFPVFDKETLTFPAHEVVDGKLVLKKGFKNEGSNKANWEDFSIVEGETGVKENSFFLAKQKMKTAISRSQGNYDNLDVIGATNKIWGRAATLFTKWRFEHYMQRFSAGKGFDLNMGKKKLKGRYVSLAQNSSAFGATLSIGLLTTLGLSTGPIALALGLTGIVGMSYLKKVFGKRDIHSEAKTGLELAAFLKTVVLESLNYPLQLININSKHMNKDFYDKLSKVNNGNLSAEDIGNLRAVAKELAIKITFIWIGLALKAGLWDDDDDPKSDKRMFHNFMDNQVSRIISSLDVWQNPNALISDLGRLAFLRWIISTQRFLTGIMTMDGEEIVKQGLNVAPIPRFLYKGSNIVLDEKEYDNTQPTDRFIKDIKTGGQWSSQQAIIKIRKNLRTELWDLFKDLPDVERKKAVNKELYKIIPSTTDGDYTSTLEEYERNN